MKQEMVVLITQSEMGLEREPSFRQIKFHAENTNS